jgi:hypothetical protein
VRIVTREQLMAEPIGTLYCHYEPRVFGQILIKGETLWPEEEGYSGDWYEQQLVELGDSREMDEKLTSAEDHGKPFDLEFDLPCRDGEFDHDQLYAIFEEKDHQELLNRLFQAYKDAYAPEEKKGIKINSVEILDN